MARLTEDQNNQDEVAESEVAKYTMSVAVKLTSVVAHRIRRFEQCGILYPLRTEARQRLFSDIEIELIKEVARLEDQGINLEGVKAILAMRKGEII